MRHRPDLDTTTRMGTQAVVVSRSGRLFGAAVRPARRGHENAERSLRPGGEPCPERAPCLARGDEAATGVHQKRVKRAPETACIDYDASMADDADESPLTRRFYRARNTEALGHALQAVRVAAGHTQTDLAHTISSSRPTISRMEHGNPTTTDTVLDALTACGYELVVVPRGSHISVTP